LAEPGLDQKLLRQMREEWDARAKENAQHYIVTRTREWEDRAFFRSGEINVANEVMPDMHVICGGSRSPLDLNVLEIGCGVGRMTRMLARIFGHVTAVDVSGEMLEQAKANLAGWDNVTLVHGNGATLAAVADQSQHFAFSFIVFQHIPSAEVIANYFREVHRVLVPGSIFKVQINGLNTPGRDAPNTWEGVSFTQEQASALCRETGFITLGSHGADTEFFWLLLRKPWPAEANAQSQASNSPTPGESRAVD
jgi:SAM-dependent methyltransferase